MNFKRKPIVFVAVLVAFILLGTVVAQGMYGEDERFSETGTATDDSISGEMPSGPSGGFVEGADGMVGDMAAPEQQRDVAPPIPGPTNPVGTGDAFVRTAQISVEVEDGTFNKVFDEAIALASQFNGFVQSSNATQSDGPGLVSGTVTIRVPSEDFDEALKVAGQLGEVTDRQVSSDDVSGQLTDYEARLRSLRVQEETYQELFRQSETVGETIEVVDYLTRVRTEIEQIEGQKAQLESKVSMSTISLRLYEPGEVFEYPEDENEKSILGEAVNEAGKQFLQVLGGMLVIAAWLAPLLLIGLIVWFVSAPFRRKTRGEGKEES